LLKEESEERKKYDNEQRGYRREVDIVTTFTICKAKVQGGKGLLKILLNTAKVPAGGAESEQYEHLKHRTKSILYSVLDDQHFAAIIHCKTANQIRTTLLSQKESLNANNKFILKRELANYRYREGLTMAEYTAGVNL
jgi:hypothetical protein